MLSPLSSRLLAGEARAPLPTQLQYVGFEDTPSRREYILLARCGEATRRYTVWIDHKAFATRKALRQDGPDICYQRLQRELVESALGGTACIGVSEGDLATYREAHAPKRRLL